MPTPFADHFSSHADAYSRFRPGYPSGLFAWLASHAPRRERAWDCGCGNGQAARELRPYFDTVVASDPSAAQIDAAERQPRLHYHVATAEASGLATASCDLIVVAQALHWFDLDRFYPELRRVARPGALFAALSYGPLQLPEPLQPLIDHFYHEVIGPYWPPERRHVDAGYATLPFPFVPLAVPPFAMTAQLDLPHLLGYLGTWSAVKNCREASGSDPLAPLEATLLPPWGAPATRHTIRWPLTVRAGYVEA